MEDQQNIHQKFKDDMSRKPVPEISYSSEEHLDLHETEGDQDALEPQEFCIHDGIVNVENPKELRYWAEQFQISMDELKSVALMQGNSIREIKNYLSV